MKARLPSLLLVFSLLLLGCAQQPNTQPQDLNKNVQQPNGTSAGAGNSMVVEKGDTIKVEYTGSFLDGNVFDSSQGKAPLQFVAGAGQMIQGFDEAVIGMKLNEEKTVTIPPEKAYGTADSARKVQVALSQIHPDGNLYVGSDLYVNGQRIGAVTDINNGIATVSIVHPLAGKTLKFWIKVVGIQKKSA